MTWPRLRFGSAFLLSLVLVTGVAFLYMVRSFIIPVLLATVFTTLFFPLYERLAKWFRGWRGVAAFTTCLILLVVLLLPFYFIIDLVAGEIRDILPNGDAERQALIAQAQGYAEKLNDLPFLPDLKLEEVDWGGLASEWAGSVGSLLARTSRGTVQIVVTLFVTLFTMFYFFLDGRRLIERLRFLVPLESRHEDAIMRRFAAVARATVRGTLVIALVQGSLGALTLWIFGVPGVALWGVVMVVMAVIPVTGVGVVLLPAAAIQALQGRYGAALGIALVTLAIAQVDNLLRPRLVGRDAGMHDLLIFFSTLGGIFTFGAMGFIVGPVLAAFFLSLLDIYAQEFQGALDAEERRTGEGKGGHASTVSEPSMQPIERPPGGLPADS